MKKSAVDHMREQAVQSQYVTSLIHKGDQFIYDLELEQFQMGEELEQMTGVKNPYPHPGKRPGFLNLLKASISTLVKTLLSMLLTIVVYAVTWVLVAGVIIVGVYLLITVW